MSKCMSMCLCLNVLLIAASAEAGTLTAFDSLGPQDLWAQGAFAWTISGNGSIVGLDISQGDAFTPTVAGNLQRIELGIMSVSGNFFSLALYEATPNGGPLLWSGSVSNPSMPPMGSVGNLTVIDIVNGPALETTKQYWLISSTFGSTNLGWGFNVIGVNGLHASRISTSNPYALSTPDGSFGSATGAFRILVPEPATLSLLALGGVAMVARRRRN